MDTQKVGAKVCRRPYTVPTCWGIGHRSAEARRADKCPTQLQVIKTEASEPWTRGRRRVRWDHEQGKARHDSNALLWLHGLRPSDPYFLGGPDCLYKTHVSSQQISFKDTIPAPAQSVSQSQSPPPCPALLFLRTAVLLRLPPSPPIPSP